MPNAHADPLDGPRTAVERARADSTCPPLNYKVDLEDVAQKYARDRKASRGDNPGPGQVVAYYGSGDPQSKAIDEMMTGGAAGAIRDCRYTDYGVGFVRYESMELDFVSVVLGPGGPPAPAAKPAPAAAEPKTATVVGGDAEIYNIAHNDVPDPATGVKGMKIGTLQAGQQVTLAAPCTPNAWCKIDVPDAPGTVGFVLGHLQF
ncbi:MAG TPA: hypothetical protein VIO95_08245 [Mycobacterium sp.]